MQQQTKKSRTLRSYVMLAIVAVLALGIVLAVVTPTLANEHAFGATSIPELDSLRITSTYDNGGLIITLPEYPSEFFSLSDKYFFVYATYELNKYDDLCIYVENTYTVSTSYINGKNRIISVTDMMNNGVSNKPSGGLVEGSYEFVCHLLYRSSSYEDEYGITHSGTNFYKDVSFEFDYPCDGLPLPTPGDKPGYTFAGWYFDDVYTMPYNGSKITSNTKLYAKFDVITYNINYECEGIVDGKTSYTVADETYTLPTPQKMGYDFVGWYDNANFSGSPIMEIPKGSIGDRTYYAKFEIQVFTVTFYVDGDVFLEMEVEYGTRLVGFYIVDKSTMTATAFSLTSDMMTSYSLETAITENVSLFASNEFAIYAGLTYNIDGVETTDLLDYNASMSGLRVPTKEGYKFEGWYYDSGFSKAVSDTDKLTSNTTVYAKFEAVTTPSTVKEKIAFYWGKVVEFLAQWWWCFAIGGGVIIIGAVVTVFVKKK